MRLQCSYIPTFEYIVIDVDRTRQPNAIITSAHTHTFSRTSAAEPPEADPARLRQELATNEQEGEREREREGGREGERERG